MGIMVVLAIGVLFWSSRTENLLGKVLDVSICLVILIVYTMRMDEVQSDGSCWTVELNSVSCCVLGNKRNRA